MKALGRFVLLTVLLHAVACQAKAVPAPPPPPDASVHEETLEKLDTLIDKVDRLERKIGR
jgi:hypothetical protein